MTNGIEVKLEENVKGKVAVEIHPLWAELIEYVKENGGHLKMNIRFKDGLPVEADDIKKKTRFDIKYQLNKKT